MRSSRSLQVLLIVAAVISAAVSAVAFAGSDPHPADLPTVERLDPALDAILPQNPVFEAVATGFEWIEGPVWIRPGYLLFAEVRSNSIRKLSAGGQVTIFMQPSGYLGPGVYSHSPGSNGMTLDRRGRLTVAGHAQRDVWRLETLDPNGQRTILADRYQGKRLNSPNDLVYRSDGSLYFTDPPYGLRTQKDTDPEKELQFNGVYRIPRAYYQKPGAPPERDQLQLLVNDLTLPNGIAFSPDEKYLYVNNSGPRKIWMRYQVKPDGSLTGGKVLADATSDPRRGIPDGMKVNQQGDIFSTGPGGIWILSAEGKHLGTILTPQNVGNMAWGGADGKTLYIMSSSTIFRVRVKIAGVTPRLTLPQD